LSNSVESGTPEFVTCPVYRQQELQKTAGRPSQDIKFKFGLAVDLKIKQKQ